MELTIFLITTKSQTFRYGKANRGRSSSSSNAVLAWVRALEVPKDWFSHFYVFAVAYNSAWWCLAFSLYFAGSPLPDCVVDLLGFLTVEDRLATTGCESAFLALTLLLLQSFRYRR